MKNKIFIGFAILILSCILVTGFFLNKNRLIINDLNSDYRVAITTDDDFIGGWIFIADDNELAYSKQFFDDFISQENLLVVDQKIIFEYPEYRVSYDGQAKEEKVKATKDYNKYSSASGQGDGYYYFSFDGVINYYNTETGERTSYETDQYTNKTYIPSQDKFIGIVSISDFLANELFLSQTTANENTLEEYNFDYDTKDKNLQYILGFNQEGSHFFTNTINYTSEYDEIFSDFPITKYNFTDKSDVTEINPKITYPDNQFNFNYQNFGSNHLSLTGGGELFHINLDTEKVSTYDVRDKLTAKSQNHLFYDAEQDIVYLATEENDIMTIYDITNDTTVGNFTITADNHWITGFAVSKK